MSSKRPSFYWELELIPVGGLPEDAEVPARMHRHNFKSRFHLICPVMDGM